MRKSWFFLVVMMILVLQGTGQEKKVDSLLSLLKNEKVDSTRFKRYLQLSKLYIGGAEKKIYTDSFLAIVQRLDRSAFWIMAYVQAANVVTQQGENRKAINYLLRAVDLCKKENNKSYLSKIYNNMANNYDVMGLYDKALSYYFESLKLKEDLKQYDKLYITRLNIATVYYNLREYDRSIEYGTTALKDCKRLNDKEREAIIYHNLGNAYGDKKLYEKGLEYYQKAIAIATEIGDGYEYTNSVMGLANTYMAMKRYAEAEKYAGMALASAEQGSFGEYIASAHSLLGLICVFEKKFGAARTHLMEALKIGQRNGAALVVQDAYKDLSQLSAGEGRFEEALEYYQLYTSVKDSMVNDNKSQLLANLQENYEIDKRQNEINFLNVDKAQQAEIIRKQKTINYFIIAFALLVSVTGILIFRGYRQKKRSNAELEKKNFLIERQKELVEEKQKEILDSIHYAKRIQRSLITSEKYISRNLLRLRKTT